MPERTITADASAERSATPDLSRVGLSVTGDGTTAAAARRNASDRAATVRDHVADAVAEGRIRTTSVEVDETDDLFEAGTDLPYCGTERLSVDCTPNTVEAVVVAATDAGATVPTVEHSLHEERRRSLQDEALAVATERAREKAARIAAVEGLTVGSVRSVRTREVNGGMESLVDEALSGWPPSQSLRPGPISVSVSVEATYGLAE